MEFRADMAEITKFTVKNFKGITSTTITLVGKVDSPILTLIGLNESGKTTILEALSHYVSGDPIISKIFEKSGPNSQSLSLIPIHKKANFTGDISIIATVVLSTNDIDDISRNALKGYKLIVDRDRLAKPFTISKAYSFKDGNITSESPLFRWGIELFVKTSKAKSFSEYQEPTEGNSLKTETWHLTRSRLPNISYFPTFLVDMPGRIYLTAHKGETPTNRHYRAVLQDILDSFDEDLNLETHVAKRIADYKAADATPNWVSLFFGTPGKSQISSVFQKISNAVSREIIGSWNKVFHRPISAKSIFWNGILTRQKATYLMPPFGYLTVIRSMRCMSALLGFAGSFPFFCSLALNR
jgi:hypothetical protein